MVRKNHPLVGQQLKVNHRAGNRRDGNVCVYLPDGSPMLLPVEFTNLSSSVDDAPSSTVGRFDLEGLRRLIHLASVLGAREDNEA